MNIKDLFHMEPRMCILMFGEDEDKWNENDKNKDNLSRYRYIGNWAYYFYIPVVTMWLKRSWNSAGTSACFHLSLSRMRLWVWNDYLLCKNTIIWCFVTSKKKKNTSHSVRTKKYKKLKTKNKFRDISLQTKTVKFLVVSKGFSLLLEKSTANTDS